MHIWCPYLDTPTQELEADTTTPQAEATADNQSEVASQKSQPRSGSSATEQEIIDALSEHAHKIAEQVLSRPHTGKDLAEDAQVRAAQSSAL